MPQSIPGEIAALALGEGAFIRGVRVVRRSLFGYQIADERRLCDAPEAARRVADHRGGVRAAPVAGEVCFRCAGDGLGRRDRGVCGVCHGRGTVSRRRAA